MKASTLAAIAACGVALSGCATIIKGTSQSIAITTPPTSGAQCTLSSREGNWMVITPGVVTVEKSKEDILAHCTKPGWQDGVATIPSDFEGWTIGNILGFPLVGLGVDAATGAINNYPHAFQIPMIPGNSSVSEAAPSVEPPAPAQRPHKMARVEKVAPPVSADPAPSIVASIEPAPVAAPPPHPAPIMEPPANSTPHLTVADGTAALAHGDYPKALAAWKIAAERGNPVALNGLGFMYERGYGVDKDPKEAVQWYEKAVAQGSYEAGVNLGSIYESGEGVKNDPVLAYMWYSIAVTASAGDDSLAQSRLDGIAKGMSASDIARAKDLTDRCQKSNFAECGD